MSLLDQEVEVNPIAQLSDLRSKVLAGEEVTSAEYAAVLASIRRARSAGPPAKGTRAKATSSPGKEFGGLDEF